MEIMESLVAESLAAPPAGAGGTAAVTTRRGPFLPGDRVQLTDPKGRMHTVVLEPGKVVPHPPGRPGRTTT